MEPLAASSPRSPALYPSPSTLSSSLLHAFSATLCYRRSASSLRLHLPHSPSFAIHSYRSRSRLRPVHCRSTVSTRAAVASPAYEDKAAKFAEAARSGNLVAMSHCIFADQLTPVTAYRCLVEEDDREVPSFLFESVEQGRRGINVGRYSVLGAQPAMEIVAKENMVTVMDHEQGQRKEEFVEDPMAVPRRIMERYSPQSIDELPDVFCGIIVVFHESRCFLSLSLSLSLFFLFSFYKLHHRHSTRKCNANIWDLVKGGWVGYFSYDTVRYVEKKKLPFSSAAEDDRNLPDVHLGLYNDVIVFDHVEKKAYVIHWVRVDRYPSIEMAYHDGKSRLDTLLSRVQNNDIPSLSAGSVNLHPRQFSKSLKMSTMESEAYKKAVLQAKEHILAGDVFQIVLSQRFERRTFADPFEVYRALRVVNPSPYMAYLQARGCVLVASSPEILTRVKKRKIVNRPLAGTVRRGKTETEDEILERQLLNDEKQCAEHIMLVDLARNDVGRVSKPGSVRVEKLMSVERYSHVMHISSTVTGEVCDHHTSWDALRIALPVGTVTGAPKVKAMELIDELEATRRGPYSGGFGGISFTGDMDIALSLRTIVFPMGCRYNTMYSYRDAGRRQEWVAHLQAGAGIVADSNPEDEQRECESKVAALACAVDLAESAFVDK